MDWFIVKDSDDRKVMINAESIMTVSYAKDTNLTVINFTRTAYPPLYVRGDITPDIKRLLNAHEHYVSNVGGI